MLGKKAVPALAAVAVGGALALAGCGDDDSTAADNATTPAGQVSDEAMKGEDAMKDHSDAMKEGGGGAMHEDEAMKDDANEP
jgi:hypothetical protein